MLAPASPTPQFWLQFVSQTPSQVADHLAKEAALLRTCAGSALPRVKQANGYLQSALEFIKNDPRLFWGLIGAGGGGLLGLGSTFLSPKEKRRPFWNTLIGALAGAGVGAAGGHFLGGAAPDSGDGKDKIPTPKEYWGAWFHAKHPETGEWQKIQLNADTPDWVDRQMIQAERDGAGYRFLPAEKAKNLTPEQAQEALDDRWSWVQHRLTDPDARDKLIGGTLAVGSIPVAGYASKVIKDRAVPEELLRDLTAQIQAKTKEYDAFQARRLAELAAPRAEFDKLMGAANKQYALEAQKAALRNQIQNLPPKPPKGPDPHKQSRMLLNQQLGDVDKAIATLARDFAANTNELGELLNQIRQAGGQADPDAIWRQVTDPNLPAHDPLRALGKSYHDAVTRPLTNEEQTLRRLFTDQDPDLGRPVMEFLEESRRNLERYRHGALSSARSQPGRWLSRVSRKAVSPVSAPIDWFFRAPANAELARQVTQVGARHGLLPGHPVRGPASLRAPVAATAGGTALLATAPFWLPHASKYLFRGLND